MKMTKRQVGALARICYSGAFARPVLEHIYIEGERASATDGFIALQFGEKTETPGDNRGLLIRAKELKSLAQGQNELSISGAGGEAHIEQHGMETTLQTEYADFPPVDKIMPEPGDNYVVVDVKFLLKVAQSMNDLGETQVKISYSEKLKPVLIQGKESRAAIMPIKESEE